jgi:hypothetical protein
VRFSFNPPVPEAIIPSSPIGPDNSSSTPAWSPPLGTPLPRNFPGDLQDNSWYKLEFCNVAGQGWRGTSVQTFPDGEGVNGANQARLDCQNSNPRPGLYPGRPNSSCLQNGYSCTRINPTP